MVANRELATRGFGPQAVLSVRFALAGGVLVALLAVRGRSLLPQPGERLRALLLGAIGYAFESVLFYAALERGSAAAVALLFYSYPALVTVAEVTSGRAALTLRLVGALGLSAAGTAAIVLTGEAVAISAAGAVLAVAAAAAFAAYLIVSDRLVPRTDALTNGAWVAIGAAVSLVAQGLATDGLRWPGPSLWLMVVNGAATGGAFALLFAALRRLGPSRTAVVMTLEAVSSVVLAALLLGERLAPPQLAGGVAVLVATVAIATSGRRVPVGVEEP